MSQGCGRAFSPPPGVPWGRHSRRAALPGIVSLPFLAFSASCCDQRDWCRGPEVSPGPLHALGRGWCISSRNVLGGAQRGVKKELNLSALVTSAQSAWAAAGGEPTPSLSSSRDCCGEQCPENRGRDVCSYPRPALTIFLSSVPVNHSLFR